MDGKHIPIVAPVENKYAYVNRKNFRSINAQADARAFNMIFTDIVAKWSRSHHDSSTMCCRFESGEYGTEWLLGSGVKSSPEIYLGKSIVTDGGSYLK